MNDHLFKIVLLSAIAIILSIIGGIMSADGDPLSLALAMAPFVIGGLYLMKANVWYLWIWIPMFLAPIGILKGYDPLLAYGMTLPFYLWNVMINRSSLTWHAIRLLDIIVLILCLYVFYSFLTHPFGLGLNLLEDYYGGKGYILFMQAALAYLCLSTLKTTSNEFGRILQWGVYLAIAGTLIGMVLNRQNPDEGAMEMASGGAMEENTRQSTFLLISVLIAQVCIISYSVQEMVKKPYRLLWLMLACIGIMLSGFRSQLLSVLFQFWIVSILYKRWMMSFMAPILAILVFTMLSFGGYLHSLPFGIQRTLAAVPFFDVDLAARMDAEGSNEWRFEMWKWALDDRENFIKDKVWGDGFAINTDILKGDLYEQSWGLNKGASQVGFASTGQWHSGPITTINHLGYIGLAIYLILSVIGMTYAWIVARIYCHHRYKLGILYVAILYFAHPPFFLFVFGETKAIAGNIIALGIIKVLFSCAREEGLYSSLYIRKAYVPLMVRQTESKGDTLRPAPMAG